MIHLEKYYSQQSESKQDTNWKQPELIRKGITFYHGILDHICLYLTDTNFYDMIAVSLEGYGE